MRVFISWSGDLSKTLADAFRRWLPSSLQFVKPYFTPSDVDKGSRWANEISKELSNSAFGIIILTPENLRSPWINFEAGAISRTIDQAKVCPIVFGVEPTDVEWPLAQFQATRFTEEDIHHLFDTMNTAAGESALSKTVADSVFQMWWPKLKEEVDAILAAARKQLSEETELRSEKQLVQEVLSLVRKISVRQEQQVLSNHRYLAGDILQPAPSLPVLGMDVSSMRPLSALARASVFVSGNAENPITQAFRETDARLRDTEAAIGGTDAKLANLEKQVDDLVGDRKGKETDRE